jgi:hypothetical protein
MTALFAYFFYYLLTVSIIFSPMDFTWVYNPYVGYRDDLAGNVCLFCCFDYNPLIRKTLKYYYPVNDVQNYLVGVGLPGIYILFCVCLGLKFLRFKGLITISHEHFVVDVKNLIN